MNSYFEIQYGTTISNTHIEILRILITLILVIQQPKWLTKSAIQWNSSQKEK